MWRMAVPDVEKLLRPPREDEDEEDQDGDETASAADDRRTTGPPLLLVLLVLTLFVAALPTFRVGCWRRGGRHAHGAHRPHPPPAVGTWRKQAHGAGHEKAAPPAELVVQQGGGAANAKRDENAGRSVLECFQPTQPVLLPQGATTSDGRVAEGTAPKVSSSCTATLMVHSFGNSYGQPFVGRLRSRPPQSMQGV